MTGPRVATSAYGDVAGGDGTARQRLQARVVALLAAVVVRLPDWIVAGMARLGGWIWYRAAPRRAGRARRNLTRIASWLAANRTGSPEGAQAATDAAALERLVRKAFVHATRGYLEMLRIPRVDGRYLADRVALEDPDLVRAALATPGPVIFAGLHLATVELPAAYVSTTTGRAITVPMETIPNPPVQRELAKSRAASGVRLVGIADAKSELRAALERGELVGIVADRDPTGGGIAVPLFGAPARLPVGPGLLAIESGAPVFATAIRRREGDRYVGRVERIAVPPTGTLRERLTGFLEEEARAFERLIAPAPEQWATVFFPIWDDGGAA